MDGVDERGRVLMGYDERLVAALGYAVCWGGGERYGGGVKKMGMSCLFSGGFLYTYLLVRARSSFLILLAQKYQPM